jgi:predicted CopG family antitoxin
MADTTTIEITKDQWSELNALKEGPGESMKDVVDRLTDAYGEIQDRGIELDCLTDDDVDAEAVAAEHETFEEFERDDDPVERDDRADDLPADHVLVNDLESIPGDGEKLIQRQQAVVAVLEYLDAEGEATPSEVKDALFEDHQARHETPRAWWKRSVQPALSELAETGRVELVDRSRGVWASRGGTA